MQDTLTPLRMFIVFLGLLLPTLALIPIGSLWLWQHGYLIHWAIATLACTVIAYAFERLTLGRPLHGRRKFAPSSAAIAMAKGGEISEVDTSRAQAEAAVEVLAKEASCGHRVLERFAEHRARNRRNGRQGLSPRPQRPNAALHGA